LQRKHTYIETPLQEIKLEETGSFNRILDVGAGGEALTARIWNDKVYGVDMRRQEIKEIAGKGVKCNWVVADARKLCFQDEVFDLATMWFSLMYIPKLDDKARVLSECKRVLRKHGFLSIKDSIIDCREDIFVLQAKFVLPNNQTVRTSYGTTGAQKQKPELVEKVLVDLGFEIKERKSSEYWFQIECKKKG